jgi:hypothetical protein
MAGSNNDVFRPLCIKKGDDLRTIYAKARKAFTAADLQRYTVVEKGIPADRLLAELDAIHREEIQKRQNHRRKKAKRQA